MPFYMMKMYRNSAEILKLVEAFERCVLPVSQWNHETYLIVAFCYVYLNPLSEAERLMSESLLRYEFENNLNAGSQTDFEEREISILFREMNDYVKRYKSFLSFVALANLILERFADQNLRLKNYQSAPSLFSRAAAKATRIEESR